MRFVYYPPLGCQLRIHVQVKKPIVVFKLNPMQKS